MMKSANLSFSIAKEFQNGTSKNSSSLLTLLLITNPLIILLLVVAIVLFYYKKIKPNLRRFNSEINTLHSVPISDQNKTHSTSNE